MALKLEEVRALADRVARSHGLDVVDVEYQGGGGKHRTLRVYIEKNEQERAKLRARIEVLQAKRESGHVAIAESDEGFVESHSDEVEDDGSFNEEGLNDEPDLETVKDVDGGADDGSDPSLLLDEDGNADELFLAGLPTVASLEFLSGITHQDCEIFSRDFGTVLDIEELVPGTEYLLEVSSPGLDRRLTQAADYQRFCGSLVKLQTFEPVAGSRHWQGRIAAVKDEAVMLELGGKQERKKPKKGAPPVSEKIEIGLANVEKAQLVPEF